MKRDPKTSLPFRFTRLRDRLASDEPSSPFLPLLLVTLAMVGLLLFQGLQLLKEHSALDAVRDAQQPAWREAQRLQAQLEGVAGATAQLAEQGNPNARLVVDALRSRGITIDPKAKR